MPYIQKELDNIAEEWNGHYVSFSRLAACPNGRPDVLHSLCENTGKPIYFILDYHLFRKYVDTVTKDLKKLTITNPFCYIVRIAIAHFSTTNR